MEIHIPTVLKDLSQAQTGELLVVNHYGAKIVGVCLTNEPGGAVVKVGLLEGEDLSWPHVIVINKSEVCGSYGSNWFVELLEGPESIPCNGTKFLEHFGAIFVSREGSAALLFGPPPERGGHSGGTFGLPNFENSKIDGDSIPYLKWKIWTSRQRYLENREKPIEVTGRAIPPR